MLEQLTEEQQKYFVSYENNTYRCGTDLVEEGEKRAPNLNIYFFYDETLKKK